MVEKKQPSLLEFQKAFPDEGSCARFLFERRWPDGFVCPKCGQGRAALLTSRAWTYECLDCGRQTSVTAGTVMHRSKLSLTAWFWAAHLMATHSNGMSALQLKGQLGLSYRATWLLTQKLRRSMVDPEREPLEGAVEVRDRATGKAQRPKRIGAKYLDTLSGRVRLAAIPSNHAIHIHPFIQSNIKPGTTLITDGHDSYQGLSGYRHDPRIVGKMAAHIPLKWIHRVFSLLKRWGLGTYHGLRRRHIDTYLNEFVFRYNRRFYRHVSFDTILGLAANREPISRWQIVGRVNPRKGRETKRVNPRWRRTANGRRQDGASKLNSPLPETDVAPL